MADEPLCDTCGRPCAGGVRHYTDPQGRPRVGCDNDQACCTAYLALSPAQRRAIAAFAEGGYYLHRATSTKEAPAP